MIVSSPYGVLCRVHVHGILADSQNETHRPAVYLDYIIHRDSNLEVGQSFWNSTSIDNKNQ
jgi:hypothetical protein